jgi:hypothetical protein
MRQISWPAGRGARRVAAIALGAVVAASLAAVAIGAPQTPPTPPAAQTPAAATAGQTTAPPGRAFASDVGLIFNPIRADATAAFEAVMSRLREALAKSPDPIRRDQAKGWKVYRAQEPGPGGTVLYLFVMDPAVKGADYSVAKILAEAFPTEVQSLYDKYNAAYAGPQSLVNLTLVQALGAGAGEKGVGSLFP